MTASITQPASVPMRRTVFGVCALLVATPVVAQRVAIGVGPTWRGASGAYTGFRRDAVMADFQVVDRPARVGWFASVSATVGESALAIPSCPNPPPGFESSCASRTLLPGSLWTVAGGVVFGPPSGTVDLMVGPAIVHTTEQLGPGQHATAFGLQGRAVVRPLPISVFGFGVDATYLTSRITSLRWQVSPRVEVRF